MKKLILIAVVLLICFADASAQYYTAHNKRWVFGHNAGLDFTSGVPVPFTSALFTNEGCASVCDAGGNLLFYSDGNTVYNRVGSIMPGGASLVPWSVSSTTNASVIVPVFSGTTQYYVFSLETEGVVGCSRMAYSIVDMTLDGGFGDIVPGSRGIRMDSLFSEKMIAVPGNGCNVWLLTHRRNQKQFYAFNITASGISAPVISSFPTPLTYTCGIGSMVVSPDRHKVAVQYNLSNPSGTELFDFDPATGIVSNIQVLETAPRMCYGAEFSPDNTKLYSQYWGYPSTVEQYDVTLPTTAAIIASRTVVATGFNGSASQMRIGPDGKIYLVSLLSASGDFLDIIDSPNLAGTACHYIDRGLAFAPGTHGVLGLPALFASGGFTVTGTMRNDTSACIPGGGTINLYPHIITPEYTWNNGDTTSFLAVSAPGTYWVQGHVGCNATVDTIHLTQIIDTVYGVIDTALCVHSDFDSFVLFAPHGFDYTWFDGNSDSTDIVYHDGDFWVGYTVACTRHIDTFHLHFVNSPGPVYGPDSVCIGNSVTFNNPSSGGIWNTSTSSIATVGASTGLVTGVSAGIATISYSLVAGCSDVKNIKVLPLPCITGITEPTVVADAICLYPNPATNDFTVSVAGTGSITGRVAIHDITGRLINTYTLTGRQITIPVATLSAGLYQCRIDINGSTQVVRKLVVMK